MRTAVDLGADFLDTAEAYAYRATSSAPPLCPYDRDKLVISIKAFFSCERYRRRP